MADVKFVQVEANGIVDILAKEATGRSILWIVGALLLIPLLLITTFSFILQNKLF